MQVFPYIRRLNMNSKLTKQTVEKPTLFLKVGVSYADATRLEKRRVTQTPSKEAIATLITPFEESDDFYRYYCKPE